jgi:nucleoid-associated protein YgaU
MSTIAFDPSSAFVVCGGRRTAVPVRSRTVHPRVAPRGAVTSVRGARQGRAQGLRLTRRGRAVVVVGALLLGSGALFSAQAAQAEAPVSSVAVSAHTVRSGDTLWSVASTVAGPGEDVRDVVAEIIRLNGMSDSSLTVGQMLLIPEE